MKNETQEDWNAAFALLRDIPQDQHSAYLDMLGMLSTTKQEAKEVVAKVAKKAKSSKKRTKKKAAAPAVKPKQSKRYPVEYNDVRLTEKEWYAFICARSLIQARDIMVEQVGGGVNGFDFLSSKTMLLHMGEAPTESACQSLGRNLRSLKSKGLLNWELERVPKGVRNLKVNFRLGLNA